MRKGHRLQRPSLDSHWRPQRADASLEVPRGALGRRVALLGERVGFRKCASSITSEPLEAAVGHVKEQKAIGACTGPGFGSVHRV